MPWNPEQSRYIKDSLLSRRKKAGLLATGAAAIGLGILSGSEGSGEETVPVGQEMVKNHLEQKDKPIELGGRSLMERVASNLSKEYAEDLGKSSEEAKVKSESGEEKLVPVFAGEKENLSDEEVRVYAGVVLDGLRKYGGNSGDSLWFRKMEQTWGYEFIEISKEVSNNGRGQILHKLREIASEIEVAEPLIAGFIYSRVGKGEKAKELFEQYANQDQLAQFYAAKIDDNFHLPDWMAGVVNSGKREGFILENLKSLEKIFSQVSPEVRAVILERIVRALNASPPDRPGSVSDPLFRSVAEFVESNEQIQ